MQYKRGFVPVVLCLIALLILLVGLVYFLFRATQGKDREIAILKVDSEVCNKDIKAEKKAFSSGEWASFNDSNFPFSFRYPKTWYLDKKSPGEIDPVEIDSFVRVSNCKETDIEKCPGQYFEFLIAKIGPIPKEAFNSVNRSATYYAFKMWEEAEVGISKDCEVSRKKYGACIPPTPGFTNIPLNSETIFTFDNSSVVDAVGLHCYGCGGDNVLGNKYILASKDNLYKVYLTTNVFSKNETQLTVNDIDNPLLELVRSLILK